MSDNGSPTFLDRAAILGLADRPHDTLHVPEWDTWVRIGTWTLAVQWRIAEASLDATMRGALLALVVVLSVVDDAGGRLFSDEDLPRLAEHKNYRALRRISDAAMAYNGIDAGAETRGKASDAAPSGASPSASPRPWA